VRSGSRRRRLPFSARSRAFPDLMRRSSTLLVPLLAALLALGCTGAVRQSVTNSPDGSVPPDAGPSVPSSIDTTGLIPADRVTVWNPGVPGGIRSYSTVFATIDAATFGNGTTDATSAINSALAAAGAAASATNPKVVFLPPGTYRITSPLYVQESYVVL